MHSCYASGTRNIHTNNFRLEERKNERERGESEIGGCRCNNKHKMYFVEA